MSDEAKSHLTKPHICAFCQHFELAPGELIGVCKQNLQHTVTGVSWYPNVQAGNMACDSFQLKETEHHGEF